MLKPGGHFSISDIVLEGDLPENIQKAAEMYAGCVSGAIQKQDYLDLIKNSGFTKDSVTKGKSRSSVPDDILSTYLNAEEMKAFHDSELEFSVLRFMQKNPVVSQVFVVDS